MRYRTFKKGWNSAGDMTKRAGGYLSNASSVVPSRDKLDFLSRVKFRSSCFNPSSFYSKDWTIKIRVGLQFEGMLKKTNAHGFRRPASFTGGIFDTPVMRHPRRAWRWIYDSHNTRRVSKEKTKDFNLSSIISVEWELHKFNMEIRTLRSSVIVLNVWYRGRLEESYSAAQSWLGSSYHILSLRPTLEQQNEILPTLSVLLPRYIFW